MRSFTPVAENFRVISEFAQVHFAYSTVEVFGAIVLVTIKVAKEEVLLVGVHCFFRKVGINELGKAISCFFRGVMPQAMSHHHQQAF